MTTLHQTMMLTNTYTKCVCVVFAALSLAQTVTAAETETEADSWQWLDRGRNRISQNVTALGRNLDAWLSGESIGDNTNESYLRIRLNQQAASFDGYHSRLKVDGSLDLPRTSERWKLIFESDATELNSLEGGVLGNESSTESMGGISYQQSTDGSWQLSHSLGLRSRLPAETQTAAASSGLELARQPSRERCWPG